MKLSRCLSDLGITDASAFEGCDHVDEEIKAIKKIWAKKVLREHPDKGGDPDAFRATQAAWEILRDLAAKNDVKNGTFQSYLGRSNASAAASDDEASVEEDDDDDWDDFDEELYRKYADNASVPSYEYFEAAAQEEVPGYRVELAKSARSKCGKCSAKIPKGDVRVGSLDKVAGTYGRWNHLECWRVPGKVQSGLTNPSDEQVSLHDLMAMEEVLLTGVGALDDASKLLFVRHCVDSSNWAGSGRKRKAPAIMEETTGSAGQQAKGAKVASKSQSASAAAKSASAESSSIVPGSFAVLVPGVNGAVGDDFLKGKGFVVAGSFPEVGGGDVDAVIKAMIQSFGGKVITRFSKNTNFLLVGQSPVANRLRDASKRSVDIISLRRLQGLLLGHVSLVELKAYPVLTSESFKGNAYQPAGTPPPRPSATQGQAMAQSAATAPSAKQSAKAKTSEAKMPSKPASTAKAQKPVPASNASVSVAAATQAIVPVSSKQSGNSSSAIVAHAGKKEKFRMPKPGVNGAVAGVLDGKRFVMTGVFPELGGGAGLSLGKDRTTSMIESFGGRVTSAVSGKTDFVLVGKDPGRSKVSAADKRGVPMIGLLTLQNLLMGQMTLEDTASAPPPRITSFSAGYPGQKRIAY